MRPELPSPIKEIGLEVTRAYPEYARLLGGPSITLWLLSDPVLLDQLGRRELAPIAKISANRRERLVETLRIWLDTRGTAARTGELLDVHPQTVRYRMRNLETIFGDQLVDPESRFSTEAVLRAMQLRARSSDVPH